MNEYEMTNHARILLSGSNEYAISLKHPNITTEVLLAELFKDSTFKYVIDEMNNHGLKDVNGLRFQLLEKVKALAVIDDEDEYNELLEREVDVLPFSSEMNNIIHVIHVNDKAISLNEIINKVVSINRHKTLLSKFGLNVDEFIERDYNLNKENKETNQDELIQKCLINYNEKIEEKLKLGELSPVIGRSHEIRDLINILSKKQKSNPVLVGEAGVGKSAIIEGFVQRLLKGDVPSNLKDKEVYILDINAVNAGTTLRGQLEEKMDKILEYVEDNPHIILFIDEIHMLMNNNKADGGNTGIGDLMKTHLARGGLSCIGATTLDEYQKYIEKDKAMERRFMKITVNEPTEEETIAILRGIKSYYEQYHKVFISDEAIQEAVKLSNRYMKNKRLPDKAIDLIDMASAKLKVENDTLPKEIDLIKREIEQIDVQLNSLVSQNTAGVDYADFLTKEKNIDDEINKLSQVKKDLEIKMESILEEFKAEKSNLKEKPELLKEIAKLENRMEQVEKTDLAEYSRLKYTEHRELLDRLEKINIKFLDTNVGFKLLKVKIDKDVIAETVSSLTGIPVRKLMEGEGSKLLQLEDSLSKRVVGQEEAVEKVADVIRISKTGIAEPNKPIGSFLFLGPTGVGKTEITKALAGVMFDNDREIIRFDMSEYSEKHNVSRLIGAAPGYVGYEEGGELTEAVKRKPYSIVLFDEIEKAHPDFSNILLQVLDDGRLTDSHKTTVDFSNTIVVLTSNIGSDLIMKETEKSVNENVDIDKEKLSKDIMDRLQKHFRPEFINRISEIVTFNALKRENINQIAKIQLDLLMNRVNEKQPFVLSYDEKALEEISELGFDVRFGARPLKRAIRTYIEKPLSKEILSNKFEEDDQILLSFEDGSFIFNKVNS